MESVLARIEDLQKIFNKNNSDNDMKMMLLKIKKQRAIDGSVLFHYFSLFVDTISFYSFNNKKDNKYDKYYDYVMNNR